MIAMMIMAIIPTLTGWGWMPEWGGVFNHLWQSTVFAAVAALLALGLRKNHAHARYWLWLAASCKFLVPFSLLVALGTSIGAGIGSGVESIIEKLWPSAPAIVAQPEMTIMFDEISQPFTQVSIPEAAPEHHSMVPEILFAIWACGCAIVLISWFRRWLRVRAAVRAATPIRLDLAAPHPLPDGRGSVTEQRASELEEEAGLKAGLPARLPAPHRMGWGWNGKRLESTRALTGAPQVIRIMSSPMLLEPGIFGIFRPVLLLPEGIADRLTPQQLQSILAHELCHVKRRDNLAAAMHMIVEAAFWFHPLVWWIGARLVEERERACDEEVLRSGSEPGVYAESILQVCKFYLESPLKCVAGVTGSDLKKRIESIMSGLPGRSLTPARKLMLIAASIGAVGGPVLVGVLTSSRIHAQSRNGATKPLEFEVAEVKVNKSADPETFGDVVPTWLSPGGLVTIRGATMKWLISEAYRVGKEGLGGAPNWLDFDCFDVIAKAGPTASRNDVRLMLQKLLAERFGLRIHRDQKVTPVYALVVGKRGPKLLKPSDDPKIKDGCQPASGAPGQIHLACHNFTAADLADSLPQMAPIFIDLPVVDLSDLKGTYDFKLDWSPRRGTGGPGRAADAPTGGDSTPGLTIFDAVEALGLKLEKSKQPISIVVIDHVDRVPTEN
jgi:bla regulator protein blaR1